MPTCQFMLFKTQWLCIISFTCRSRVRLTFSSKSFKTWCRILTFSSRLISGPTFGVLQLSSRKAYRILTGHRFVYQAFRWLLKSSCQNKRKFFFWLVLQHWLSTHHLLHRRNMFLPYYSCVHCVNSTEETLECTFALACWSMLNLSIKAHTDFFPVIVSLKNRIRLHFYMEIVVTMCWSMWTIRNDIIFRNMPASVQRCKPIFKEEFALVILRSRDRYHPTNIFMARSLCVISLIFFVSFFVSWNFVLDLFIKFNKAQ